VGDWVAGAERLERRWWLPLIGVGMVGVGALIFSSVVVPMLGFFLVIIGGFFAVQSWQQKAFPIARPVVLRLSEGGLAIDGEAAIEADTIAEVTTLTRGQRQEVSLVLRDGTTRWLRLLPADARRLLAGLGLDAGRRRASFSLVPAYRWRYLVTFLPILSILVLFDPTRSSDVRWMEGNLIPYVSLSAMCAWPLAWVVGFFLRGRAIVGADGLVVRWAFWSRFIPFREVAEISWSLRRVVVQRRGRRPIALRPREITTFDRDVGAETRALFGHLRDALGRWRALLVQPSPTHALGNARGEDPAAWLRSLDALADAPERYRVAAPAVDHLPAVLENAAMAPEARVGAAVALLRRGDEASRARVRAVADGCASPGLRATLLSLEEARSDEDYLETLASLDRALLRGRTAG
jgi:hypothetical protein